MTTMKIRIVMHYEFKLKNSAADAARNINKACGNILFTNVPFNVGIKNLIPGMNFLKTNRSVGQHP